MLRSRPTTVLLDGNIYDCLKKDPTSAELLAERITQRRIRIIATPIIADELADGPFGGIPEWFPVELEVESVAVLGYWRLGSARLGGGATYTEHRGESGNIKDAIIADSANSLADIFVSEDKRCRNRLAQISEWCISWNYLEFKNWLLDPQPVGDSTLR